MRSDSSKASGSRSDWKRSSAAARSGTRRVTWSNTAAASVACERIGSLVRELTGLEAGRLARLIAAREVRHARW